MRPLTVFLFAACLSASASGTAQSVTLSGKALTYEQVFAAIKKQTGYVAVYEPELFPHNKTLSLSVTDMLVSDFLSLVFKDQPLEYVILDKTVIVFRKSPAVSDRHGKFLVVSSDQPVLVPITGRITDSVGRPLSGATVALNNKVLGVTNAEGFFNLDVTEGDVLTVTFVGYEPRSIIVTSSMLSSTNNLVITLNPSVTELDEVTVSTGYQDIPKERATGSFVKIDNNLFNRRTSPDFLSRLEGVSSGVLFDATSGNALDLSIRGRSTIFANTQPLIVLDNYPFTGDLSTINPNDIESITILKDAAAASIWGAFSGNGVIVVTTKKGRFNQPLRVEFNSNLTISDRPDLFYSPQFLKSSEFIEVEKFLFSKGFYDNDINNVFSMPPVSPVVEILARERSGEIDQVVSEQLLSELYKNDIRSEYEKHFYRKSISQQYSLNLSGGSNNSNYYISAGYDQNLTNVVGNTTNRLTFNSVTTFKPISNLTITGSIAHTQMINKNNGMQDVSTGGKYSTIYPYAKLTDEKGNPVPIVKDYRYRFVSDPGIKGLLDWRYIPLNELKYLDNVTKGFDNRLSASVTYSANKYLNISVLYQHQRGVNHIRNYYSEETYLVRNFINRYSSVVNDSVVKRNIPLGSLLIEGTSINVSQTGRGQLSYNKSWNKHSIAAIGGVDIREFHVESNSVTNYGYDPNTGRYTDVNYESLFELNPSGSARIPTFGNGVQPRRLTRFRSFLGNFSYTYDSRITVSGSMRLDQANVFGVKTNQKGTPLWSTGLKWDLSSEKFYKLLWLPVLRLRATYGFNGNLASSFTAATTITYISSNLNNIPYADIATIGNSQLKWEKNGMLNLGIDFEFRKILNGSIEYFRKNGVDLIGDAFIPSSTGFYSATGNYSNMKGQGIDVILNTHVHGKLFDWKTTFLGSYATDKVTKNEGNSGIIVGRPVNTVTSYRWAGLDQNGDPMGFLNGEISKNYLDIVSAASISPNENLKYNGPRNPQFFGGFRNTFTWRNFSISVNLIYKLGYYFKRSSILYSNLYNNGLGHIDFENRWKKPGDERITTVPSMVYVNYPQFITRDAFYANSEVLVERGDHVRLQDINFTYQFKKMQSGKLKVSNLELYIYANNLGIIWKANSKDLDPNYTNGYPPPFAVSFGLRATF